MKNKEPSIFWQSRPGKALTFAKKLGNLAIVASLIGFSAIHILSTFAPLQFANPLHFGALALMFGGCAIVVLVSGRKSIFGQDTFKLETKEGKLTIEADTKKGLLDKVGYHNHYSRVSVDKVIKDLTVENLGLKKEFEQRDEQLITALESHLEKVKTLVPTEDKELREKANEDFEKAFDQADKATAKLEALISKRTLAALKANEKFFPESDKSKMNTSYIIKGIKGKF